MDRDMLRTGDILSLDHSEAGELLASLGAPWEVLPLIREFILGLIERLPRDEYLAPAHDIRIHRSAKVYESAYIAGPCVIGAGSELRHSAFIRGSALVGRDCVVGNATELKNVILFDGVEVPHYNYVGDSVLGQGAHMGAGSITSNVRGDRGLVKVHFADCDAETGLRKFGAILGDRAEIGCGSVLNPGTVVGADTIVYPLSGVRQVIDSRVIYKQSGEIIPRVMG